MKGTVSRSLIQRRWLPIVPPKFAITPRSLYILDIDECEDGSNDCHKDATCMNSAGHFNCSCNKGHIGDGRQCAGKLANHPAHFETAVCIRYAKNIDCTPV